MFFFKERTFFIKIIFLEFIAFIVSILLFIFLLVDTPEYEHTFPTDSGS
jgi:hypothetical protein